MIELHKLETISSMKDVTFARMSVNGGWIYIVKNSNSMTSSFVPDLVNSQVINKELIYSAGFEEGYNKAKRDFNET